MKISDVESGKAAGARAVGRECPKILPTDRPRGSVSAKKQKSEFLSPLEKGMVVAEAALTQVPDVRDELVETIKQRILKGEYQVNGRDVADMMLRRLAADNIR